MNELAVKTVDFYGDSLTALKDNDGIIWTGVNSFCRGIGLSKSQRDTQIQNIQSDEVLKMGCLKFQAGVFDANNETLALQLDYVPLWLAKISITPNMKENNPELVEKLVNYQLKAKDVLAAAFLPQPHNVKTLTVTSRDVCKMLGRHLRNHSVILREIRECIAELEEIGFNRQDFFMDSTYLSAQKEIQPQFLCTERGCEYFSGRLEPADRRIFIAEFKDRFNRLQGVLDGNPVKDIERTDGETIFRLYQNNQWGILVFDDEVYNLTPDEMTFISNIVPRLDKNGVRQIKTVVQTYLDNSRKGGKLEKIGEYHCLNGEISENSALPEVATSEKTRRLKIDETRNLNEVINLTIEDAKTRYRMGRNGLIKIADEIGARVGSCAPGKRALFDRKKLDEYFHSISK